MKNWQRAKSDANFRKQLLVRGQIVDAIRSFFKSEGFLEVETPLLVKHPGTEPYLEVFQTELRVAGQAPQPAFLLTSPELSMKKLLSAGFGSMFQICKSFRNEEGVSSFHNPEFTILEWYRVNADYTDIMDDFEKLMLHILRELGHTGSELTYQSKTYDLNAPWERISIARAFEKYAGVDEETLLSEEKLKSAAVAMGYNVTVDTSWEEVYNQILLNEIEPRLGVDGPTVLYDYPASQAALSRRKTDDSRFAERFEVYFAGLELGNAFTELTDPSEQRQRMENDLAERRQLGKTEYGLDEDFLAALGDMPPTGGIAVGVDRLVMLFADAPTLDETLFFPAKDLFDLSPEEV